MNDFTKDELRLILHYHPHGNDSLCRKVREMIDNYCEHKECDHAWIIARDKAISIDECVRRFSFALSAIRLTNE